MSTNPACSGPLGPNPPIKIGKSVEDGHPRRKDRLSYTLGDHRMHQSKRFSPSGIARKGPLTNSEQIFTFRAKRLRAGFFSGVRVIPGMVFPPEPLPWHQRVTSYVRTFILRNRWLPSPFGSCLAETLEVFYGSQRLRQNLEQQGFSSCEQIQDAHMRADQSPHPEKRS